MTPEIDARDYLSCGVMNISSEEESFYFVRMSDLSDADAQIVSDEVANEMRDCLRRTWKDAPASRYELATEFIPCKLSEILIVLFLAAFLGDDDSRSSAKSDLCSESIKGCIDYLMKAENVNISSSFIGEIHQWSFCMEALHSPAENGAVDVLMDDLSRLLSLLMSDDKLMQKLRETAKAIKAASEL